MSFLEKVLLSECRNIILFALSSSWIRLRFIPVIVMFYLKRFCCFLNSRVMPCQCSEWGKLSCPHIHRHLWMFL